MSIDLRQTFLQAPFTAEGWQRGLTALADAMRSKFVNIGEFTPETGIMRPFLSNTLDRNLMRDVEAVRAYSDTVNWRLTAVTAPFVTIAEDVLNAARRERRYARSPYHDLTSTHDLPNGCQTVLSAGSDSMLAMWTHRGQTEGVTAADELALFGSVAHDVLQVIRLEQAVASQGVAMVNGALETMQAAAFILDRSGRMLAITPAGARLAARQDVIGVMHGALRAIDRPSDNRLQAAIAEALQAGPAAVARRLWLRATDGLCDGLTAEVYPLPRRAWNFDFEPRAIVVLRAPAGIDRVTTMTLLRQNFDLSPAEADISLALAQGQSRAAIARNRDVSLDTVNAQLKSIYRKTDVRREAELVALVVRMAN